MATVVEKVEALIARTSSEFSAEARTSALIACKLIRDHKLLVTTKDGQSEPRDVEDVVMRKIYSKYESKCIVCNAYTCRGARVWWFKGCGICCTPACATEFRSVMKG
jgi:hypothetical protein